MNNNKHIPPLGNLPEDKLLAYLEGRLSPQEQREVEAFLAKDSMESDALEGLNELPVQDAKQAAARINYRLQHDLKVKKYRGKKLYADNKWAWLAVVIVLLLCMLAYMIVYLQK